MSKDNIRETYIQSRIKDIPKINKERPCSSCAHYAKHRSVKCRLSLGHCDFYHSGFEPIGESNKTKRN